MPVLSALLKGTLCVIIKIDFLRRFFDPEQFLLKTGFIRYLES
ncbi:conserved hypothetical protein [Xenorhabdus nematophila F1]|uniref:Uncharacterized protein n=1 Tax=Xenorhabdus nematophila (strain ATCC 19061 / DSM 3370 / CCUG 14189 / LMG 1036 / NCIMB 9965 / AN6) TaxID=406817 RepID=D3VC31_XENNA|nr:hypothetical protein XNC1_1621 [Xenorhabdus nematophila ATCC 19061]CCW29933.1 conserved hypothetical protein [Xenorhabdus nematophila F1]CEE94229.1 hypothetical protein XNA1_4530011 [Xenorhabdus nematophila str. Anatoliense]CEF29891.1 hypothetical protein XNW1_2090009 [Xenorhabdus nematophila str. Websteri]CEK22569.1 hypothetical protein XNC2_1575 [Xenorhabdus nematophila AN6/1]